eukprot:s1473_g3.t1
MPTPTLTNDEQFWELLRQEVRLEIQKAQNDESVKDLRWELLQLRQEVQSDLQSINTRLGALEMRPLASGAPGERSARNSIWKVASDGEPNSNKHSNFSNFTNNSASPDATTIPVEEVEEISVSFEESAWSIPMVIGLVRAGRFDMVYAVVLLLVNCAMQIMFALILLDEGFMGEDFETQKHNAQIWRTSVAHDYKYMDLAETSLVTRVCSGDGALILSTIQATLIEQINNYLRLGIDQFEQDQFGPGTLLCMLCILLWSLCVFKEFRHIWLAVAGAVNLPKSRHTVFTEGTFEQISWGRFVVFLATNFARIAVASVLLVAGILWLARTTSISELMLNAVALNAILDVDEFLFNGLTPMKFQHAIQSLTPMTIKYSRRRSEWESCIQCITLVLTIIVPYMLLVKPFGETMVEVKELLCGGNQTFVIFHNADTQMTNGLVTRTSRGGNQENLSISEIAVNAHAFRDPGLDPMYIQFQNLENFDQFEEERTNDMATWANSASICIETAVYVPGGAFFGDPSIRPVGDLIIRSAGLPFGELEVSDCSMLQKYCRRSDARLVRFACGQTCGCTDVNSPPWYKVGSQGCAPSCLRLAQPECEDVTPESLRMSAWLSFWNDYPTVVNDAFSTDVTRTAVWQNVNDSINMMKVVGCPGLEIVPVDFFSGATYCEGFADLFQPLAYLCPETCGCKQPGAPLSHCPTSCLAAAAAAGNTSQR